MTHISPEVNEYLQAPQDLKQVLLVLKPAVNVWNSRTQKAPLAGARLPRVALAHAEVFEILNDAKLRDERVQYNSLAEIDTVALKAPAQVIHRLAGLDDVEEVIVDEPTEMLMDSDFALAEEPTAGESPSAREHELF